MFCEKCGMQNNQNANFCVSCGNQLNKEQTNNQNVQSNISSFNTGFQQPMQQVNASYQQSQYQNNANSINQNKKIKTYWWLPVVLFFGGVACAIIRFVLTLLALDENGSVATEGIIPVINSILGVVYILALFLVFPSIIFVVIRYAIKKNG